MIKIEKIKTRRERTVRTRERGNRGIVERRHRSRTKKTGQESEQERVRKEEGKENNEKRQRKMRVMERDRMRGIGKTKLGK